VEEVNTKIKSAITDKNRIRVKDKGNPDICIVSKYHETFNENEHKNICEMCRNANIGCAACKSLLSEKVNSLLAPFREKRAYYEEHKGEVRDIIFDGSKKANMVGNKTVENVKKAMSIYME
jgi:tryptophanyl-tRNA synthetase